MSRSEWNESFFENASARFNLISTESFIHFSSKINGTAIVSLVSIKSYIKHPRLPANSQNSRDGVITIRMPSLISKSFDQNTRCHDSSSRLREKKKFHFNVKNENTRKCAIVKLKIHENENYGIDIWKN